MIPFPNGATALPIEQFVFFPSYDQTTAGDISTLNYAHMLPGNALTLTTAALPKIGTLYFSDTYHQVCPTGQQQWAPFYEQYIVHGSAVEVTLVDCSRAGQLIVLPVITSTTIQDLASPYDFVPGESTECIRFDRWNSNS